MPTLTLQQGSNAGTFFRFQGSENADWTKVAPEYTTQTGETWTKPPLNSYGVSFNTFFWLYDNTPMAVIKSYSCTEWSTTDAAPNDPTYYYDWSQTPTSDLTLYPIWVEDSSAPLTDYVVITCTSQVNGNPNTSEVIDPLPVLIYVQNGSLPTYAYTSDGGINAAPTWKVPNDVGGTPMTYTFVGFTDRVHIDPPPYDEEYPLYDWGIRVGTGGAEGSVKAFTLYTVWREGGETEEEIEPPYPAEVILRSLTLDGTSYETSHVTAKFDIIVDEDSTHPIDTGTLSVHQCVEWTHTGNDHYTGYTYQYDEEEYIIGYAQPDEGEDGGEEGDGGDEAMVAAVADGTWSRDGNNWVFTQSNGTVARSKWLDIEHSDGHVYRYHFTSSGHANLGWFVSKGLDYYAEETGDYAGTLWHERDDLDGGLERWTDPPSLTEEDEEDGGEEGEPITVEYRTRIASFDIPYDDLADGHFTLTYGRSGQELTVQDGAILSFSVVLENEAGKTISTGYTEEAFAIPTEPRLSVIRAWKGEEPFDEAYGSYTYTGDTMGELVWWTGLRDEDNDGILDKSTGVGSWSVSQQSWYLGDFSGTITATNVPNDFVGLQARAITAEMSESIELYYGAAAWWAKPYNDRHAWQGRLSTIVWLAYTDVTEDKSLGVLVFDSETGRFVMDITCLVTAANIQQKILTTTQSSMTVALRGANTPSDDDREIRNWPTDEDGHRVPGIPAPPNSAEEDQASPGTDAQALLDALQPIKGLVLLISYGIPIGGGIVSRRVINITNNTIELTLSSIEMVFQASYMTPQVCEDRPQAAILHYITEDITEPFGSRLLITNEGAVADENTSRRDRTYEEMDYTTCLEAMQSLTEASTKEPFFIWTRYSLMATEPSQAGLVATSQLCYSEGLPLIPEAEIPACLMSSFTYTEDFSIGKYANQVAMTAQVDEDEEAGIEAQTLTSGWQESETGTNGRPIWRYATSTDSTIVKQETLNQKALATATSMSEGTVDKSFAIPLNTDTARYIILTGQLYRKITISPPDIQRFRLAVAIRPNVTGYIVSWTAAYTGAWTFSFDLQSEREIGAIPDIRVSDEE